MRPANETVTRSGRHCAYCGHALAGDAPVIERFGEPFCSEPHAEEFTAGVRAARMQAAAGTDSPGAACALSAAGRSGWRDVLKRAARRHEQVPQPRFARLRLQVLNDLERLPAAAIGLLLVIVADSRADLGIHEITDAIAERSLSFRKVKVQRVAFPLSACAFAADFR